MMLLYFFVLNLPKRFNFIKKDMGIGIKELLIILVIVLILFGASRIPKLMRGLGEGLREFKKGISGESESKQDNSQKNE